ncbi:hypothetical protein MG293_014926 [Ovis ammon polii]|uniref:Uncharacterized protein n=1 Tax=Ovis ammon polii TaxID=230172 RepID=A0AAD4TVE2_OVIAM|nr:hypothetical protein MG293_014926 [Ovis ammon polii]
MAGKVFAKSSLIETETPDVINFADTRSSVIRRLVLGLEPVVTVASTHQWDGETSQREAPGGLLSLAAILPKLNGLKIRDLWENRKSRVKSTCTQQVMKRQFSSPPSERRPGWGKLILHPLAEGPCGLALPETCLHRMLWNPRFSSARII